MCYAIVRRRFPGQGVSPASRRGARGQYIVSRQRSNDHHYRRSRQRIHLRQGVRKVATHPQVCSLWRLKPWTAVLAVSRNAVLRMRCAVALVVPYQSSCRIAGNADVVPWRGVAGLQHVHEMLLRHLVHRRKCPAGENAREMTGQSVVSASVRGFCVRQHSRDREFVQPALLGCDAPARHPGTRLAEPKLVHGKDGPASASLRDVSARHPSRGLPSRSSRCAVSSRERRMVDQNSASWNRLTSWLRRVEALRAAA